MCVVGGGCNFSDAQFKQLSTTSKTLIVAICLCPELHLVKLALLLLQEDLHSRVYMKAVNVPGPTNTNAGWRTATM